MRRFLIFSLTFIAITSFATEINIEEQEKKVEEMIERIKREKLIEKSEQKYQEYIKNRIDIEKIKKLVEEGKKKMEKYKEKLNTKIGKQSTNEEKKEKDGRLLLIFMSSSVPEEVWYNYARYIANNRINAIFLLRGCIGGCRYIKPTLKFVKKVMTLGGMEKRELPLGFLIDPKRFREYGVSAVPCIAFEGNKKLSCGDWSLKWHIKRLKEEGE